MNRWSRVDWFYAVVLAATRLLKVVPNERIHKHKICGRDDDEAILYNFAERSLK